MVVKQMSIFMENKPGQLAELTDVLNANNIDMRAMSLAETEDFGILRLIVDDTYRTACVLKESGYVFSMTSVLAVAIPDEPGGLTKVLNVLKKQEINVDYAYAFTARIKDMAYMIFRVGDNDIAKEALKQAGIQLLSQEELDKI